MADSKDPTHTAFAIKREGKKHTRYLEVGTGRQDSDGTFHAFLDRLPIGGFNGYIHFVPKGTEPPQPEPTRPGEDEELG